MAESADSIVRLLSLVDTEDGIEQLFSPVEVNDIPDGKYVEPLYVNIQREKQLRAEAERKRLEEERQLREQEEKRIKAEQKKAAKEGRNPRTGETVKIPARVAVKGKAGSKLKEALN